MKLKNKSSFGNIYWERSKKLMPGGNMFLSKRPERFLPGKWLTYYPSGSVEWILFYLNDKINPNKLCSNWYETGYKKIEGFLVEYKNQVIWDGKYIEYSGETSWWIKPDGKWTEIPDSI